MEIKILDIDKNPFENKQILIRAIKIFYGKSLLISMIKNYIIN
jgi:hypothetical protein